MAHHTQCAELCRKWNAVRNQSICTRARRYLLSIYHRQPKGFRYPAQRHTHAQARRESVHHMICNTFIKHQSAPINLIRIFYRSLLSPVYNLSQCRLHPCRRWGASWMRDMHIRFLSCKIDPISNVISRVRFAASTCTRRHKRDFHFELIINVRPSHSLLGFSTEKYSRMIIY